MTRSMVDELLSIFARFEDYDGIHHFATQALNLVPENVKAQYWLVYSIYHVYFITSFKKNFGTTPYQYMHRSIQWQEQ